MGKTLLEGVHLIDEEGAQNNPAIGLVATDENSDQIAGTILRARKHNYRTIVTGPENCEGMTFARSLGSLVVTPSDDQADVKHPKERLAAIARIEGHPGLLYHPDPAKPIDFSISNEALVENGLFVIEARTAPVTEQEPTVLVGIPVYNEADTIGSVVQTTLQYVDEVLVVDDGSTDETALRAKEAGATVIQHETNRGYGGALKTLFKQASKTHAEHLIVLDGDGQHDATDIPELVDTQQETGAEIVIASRFGDRSDTEMPLYRRFGLGVINALTNLSLGIIYSSSRISDTQSGFRAYNREAIESIAADDTIGDHMSASIDIIYHACAKGYDVEELSTTIDYSVENGSSHNPIEHGITLLMNILRTIERERPITMLGIPGVICMLTGFGFGYWTVYNYLQFGSFPSGVALFAVFLTLIGVLTAFTAIILHSLAVYAKPGGGEPL